MINNYTVTVEIGGTEPNETVLYYQNGALASARYYALTRSFAGLARHGHAPVRLTLANDNHMIDQFTHEWH